MNNTLNSFKQYVKQSTSNFTNSLDKVSNNVSMQITPLIDSIRQSNNLNIFDVESTQIPEQISKSPITENNIINNNVNNNIDDNVNPFEKQFDSQFIGCFPDDPSNPSMEEYLGEVTNLVECIELGKNKKFDYIGIQQGNKCFASNKIPITQKVDRNKFCNIGCTESNTGNCGGYFYNQVYKTITPNILPNLVTPEIKSETIKLIENFTNYDNDIKKISLGLSDNQFNCHLPINVYTLFFWMMILLLLIYLLFEYMYRKNNKYN